MTFFLVRNLPDSIRDLLEADALKQDLPIQEVMRQILCAHYELSCEPLNRNSWQRRDAWEGSRRVHLMLHDHLWAALKQDASETGESMQNLLHAALAAHYEIGAVT